MKISLQKILCFPACLIGAFVLLAAITNPLRAEGEPEPIPSYRYIMVYGTGELETGDVVEFFDPAGTLCGRWTVKEEGFYGLMAVYGDDAQTVDIDEGAREGEVLTIRLNGREVYPVGGPLVWEREGETRRVDL